METNDSPLPLEVIPNNMGINLRSGRAIEWTRQGDGQLVPLNIKFVPENNMKTRKGLLLALTKAMEEGDIPDIGRYLDDIRLEVVDTHQSGDKFKHVDGEGNTTVYVLQKLPDFDLWVLVRENGGTYWAGPSGTPDKAGCIDMTKMGKPGKEPEPDNDTQPMDLSVFCMAYESGELEFEEVVEGFQQLIDTGLAWTLQGSYGRMAQRLIDGGGYCHA